MPVSLDVVVRVELAEAADAARVAASLAAATGGARTSAWPLGGGRLVITGPGFYVNRAIAAGLVAPVTSADLDDLERRCDAAGVPPELEVCPWADGSLLVLAGDRGYRPTWFRTVLVRQPVLISRPPPPPTVEIRTVEDDVDLEHWHAVTVAGFGLATRRQQDVARRWGEALLRIGDRRLLIARRDGHTVGVASIAAHDGVALLGGMTTRPEARNQGVQQALIAFRLQRAQAMGCTVAASTADPGSGSERNLERSGFAIVGTKIGVALPRPHLGD